MERLFSGLPAGSFVGGCQSCEVNDMRRMFRHYFFRKNLPFPNLFRNWSRKFQHSWRFISAVSSELVSGAEIYILRSIGLFWKFLFLFTTFWEVMETSFSSKNSKTGGPNCNLYVQKSNPKNFYIEYFDFSAKGFVRISKPAFKTTRKTICRKRFS